jgi:hypothetical protein
MILYLAEISTGGAPGAHAILCSSMAPLNVDGPRASRQTARAVQE